MTADGAAPRGHGGAAVVCKPWLAVAAWLLTAFPAAYAAQVMMWILMLPLLLAAVIVWCRFFRSFGADPAPPSALRSFFGSALTLLGAFFLVATAVGTAGGMGADALREMRSLPAYNNGMSDPLSFLQHWRISAAIDAMAWWPVGPAVAILGMRLRGVRSDRALVTAFLSSITSLLGVVGTHGLLLWRHMLVLTA